MDPAVTPGAQQCAPERNSAGQKSAGSADGGGVPVSKQLDDAIAVRIEDLPPPGVVRWVIRRKAQVVLAVQSGAITLEEVCRRYTLTVEEFQSWQNSIERHGLYGLRTTRLQIYRSSPGRGES
jgi:hypothetical protein